MYHNPIEVRVCGDAACFTRPELKVERVTYPVITPSAARGVLEAIFWKPEFRWRIREIQVLKPIKYFSILRNEVNSRASERAARTWERSGGGFYPSDDRAQRNTLALADVEYLIKADVELRADVREDAAKYRDQARRRIERGQCFAQPYLGTREFSAFFQEPDGTESAIPVSMDLGRMLLDLDYQPGPSGSAIPMFFSPSLDHGVMRVNWEEARRAAPTTR